MQIRFDANGKPFQVPDRYIERFDSVRATLEKNAAALHMSELWLFGSVARGTSTLESDLDFMVVVQCKELRKESSINIEVLDVREDVDYPHVDVFARTTDFLNDMSWVFSQKLAKDKIVLWRA